MTRSRIAFAYSLILCSSLSLNCLTVQQTWAADSAPAATTGASTPAATGAAATTPAASGPATTAAASPAASTATGSAPPASTTPGTSTGSPAGTSTPAAASSNTLAPTAPGPLQRDRNNVRNWVLAAQKRGVGIGGYQKAFDDMENSVRAGEPEANVKKKLDSMLRAINDQYHTSAKIQRDRRPGVRTGGVVPYSVGYEGSLKNWQGRQVEEGTITDEEDAAYKKALDKLADNERKTGEHSDGMYVSDETGLSRLSPRDPDALGRLNPRQQLNEQREEQRKLLLYKWKGQVQGKQKLYPSQMDLIRNSNTGRYYEKSKLYQQQKQFSEQKLNERYGKDSWTPPPFNQGDF